MDHSTATNNIPSSEKIELSFLDIEYLYILYFNKTVQDTIVIVAILIQIKFIIHQYYVSNTKEKCSSVKYKKIKKMIDDKLKLHFDDIVNTFHKSNFKHAFQMLVVSIYKVLLTSSYAKTNDSDDYLSFLIKIHHCNLARYPTSMSLSNYDDYIHLIDLIENGQTSDNIINIFYITEITGIEMFPLIIKNILSPEFETLINTATEEFRKNSKFKDPRVVKSKYVNILMKFNYYNVILLLACDMFIGPSL